MADSKFVCWLEIPQKFKFPMIFLTNLFSFRSRRSQTKLVVNHAVEISPPKDGEGGVRRSVLAKNVSPFLFLKKILFFFLLINSQIYQRVWSRRLIPKSQHSTSPSKILSNSTQMPGSWGLDCKTQTRSGVNINGKHINRLVRGDWISVPVWSISQTWMLRNV